MPERRSKTNQAVIQRVTLTLFFCLLASFAFAAVDRTPPTGTVKINNGAAYTNSTSVTLTLAAQDNKDGSGISQMRFSNDNKTWSTPETYTTSKDWTLSTGNGTKTVYARFKDIVGNWSIAYSDSIILDTTLPTGGISINNNATKTASLVVTLNLSANDASGISQMQLSNDNVTWSNPMPFASSKPWVLLTGDGTKIVYVKYKDNAGNWSKTYYDTIILDTTPPAISNVRTTNITATTASILWDTDTAGTSQVEYGLTSSYGLKSAYLAQLVTQHSVPLGGLKQYTVYHFRVISKDDIGNTSVSQDCALITKDVTPPQGTIAINNNAPYTNSPKVTLNFTMQDTGSGIKEMQFSADNKTWTAFEQFNSQKSWVLTAGDGTKTAYARFKDNAGNLSVIYSDSIILDTTLPTGSISINNNAAKTATVAVTLNLSAKDASGLTQMQFSNDNANWSDPEKYASTKTWTLLPLNGLKTVYVRFKDNAGNWSAIYSDSITFYQPAPAAPTIDKVTSPANQDFQVISGKKSPDTTEIIVTCATAKPQAAKIINNTSWICTIKDLKEGANTISVKARNAGGLESSPVSVTIVLDTQGPSIDITSPKEGEVVK